MSSTNSLIKQNAVAIYFIITFALSWGCMNLLVKPYSFPLTAEQSEAVGPFLYVGMLVGPSIAGLLLIGLVDGVAGYKELFSRLSKWRIDIRWYAVVLGAPLLATGILSLLSLFSPEFTPALFTSSDKSGLIMMAVGVGLMVGLFEEIGWTGFGIPHLRQSYGIKTTGLMVGLLWGAWHFPPFWETNSFTNMFPFALLLVRLFAWLPPFRVLMVWVHEQTGSLLLTVLMHASLVFATLILPSMTLSGTNLLIWLIAWGVSLSALSLTIPKTTPLSSLNL